MGGVTSTPVINRPEVAIIAVNKVREMPVIVDGELEARKLMNLSLSLRPPGRRRLGRGQLHADDEGPDRKPDPAAIRRLTMATSDLDQAPVATDGALGSVPVIDLREPRRQLIRELDRACTDWGFFQVRGHGVPQPVFERLLATAQHFFALPRDMKRQSLRSPDNPWGYYDRELTKNVRDKKEVFDIGPDAAG